MEKQITLNYKEFKEIENKADLYDKNTIAVNFLFSRFSVNTVRVITNAYNNPLIDKDAKMEISKIIRDICDEHEDIVVLHNKQIKDKELDKEQDAEVLRRQLAKIPNWIKSIFL